MIICKAGQEFATLTSLQKNSDGCSGGDRSVAAFAPPFFCEDRSLTTVLLYKSIIAPLPFSLNRAVFKPLPERSGFFSAKAQADSACPVCRQHCRTPIAKKEGL